jgi:predicted nucleotidyltransferase
MNKQIVFPKDQIAEFCRRHHIRRLAVFGSALRSDVNETSDSDIYWLRSNRTTFPACSEWHAWNASFRRFSAAAKLIYARRKI